MRAVRVNRAAGGTLEGMSIDDGYVHQLPDTDPAETEEWLDSLDAVVDVHGRKPGPRS